MDLDTTGLTPLDAAPTAQPQPLDVSGLTPVERALPWESAAPGQEQAKWSEVPGAIAEFGKQTIQGIGSALSLPGDVFEAGYKGNANPLEDPEMQARAVNLAGLVTLGGRGAPREAPIGNAEQFLREADAVDARLRGAKTKAEIDEFIRSKEAERAAAPDTSQKLLTGPKTTPEPEVAAPPAPPAPAKPVSGVPLADSLRERLGLTGEPPAEEPAPEPPQAAVGPTNEAPGLEGDYRTSEGKIIRVRKAPDNQYTIATDTTESRPGTDAFVNRILASEKAEPVTPPSTQMVGPVDSLQPTPEKYQQEPPENPFVMARNGDLTADSARDVADRLKDRQQEIENDIFGGKEVADQWRKLHRQSDSAWNSANDAKAREYDAKLTAIENKANLTESDQAFLNGEGWPEHSDPDAWKELSRDLRDVEGDRDDAVTTLGYTLRRLPDADKTLSETDHRTLAVIQHAMDEESKRGGDPEAFLRDAFAKSAQRYGGGPDAQEIVTDDIAKLKGLMGNRAALGTAPPVQEPIQTPPETLPAPRAPWQAKNPLSIAQFIARNGGLELSDETKARDYDKVFVPGGGPLARKSGLSIDGYWRTKLMEAGYFPYDPDGYSSRDIRPELDDALHQDVAALKGSGSDRFYSENDRGRVPAKPEAISDVEAAAKQILDAHAKEGVTRDQIDTKSLYDAAELLVNGEEKDPINALERAYLQEHHNEAERGDTRQTGAQIAGEGEQGIGPRPQESPLGGGENWAGFSESGKEPTDIGAEGFSQPKQASLDEFKAHIAQLKADRDAFKSEIQQAMDTNGRYKMDVNYGNGQNSLLLTKNIGELPYRVTRFDGKEPTGHFEVRNLDEAAQEMIGSRKKPPQTETGVEGKPQLVIPGAEKIGQGELAQRAANAPLKPTVAQKAADEGLFGDAHKQKDLFGEGTPSPSTMKDLGPFEHDKNAPLGGQAQIKTKGLPTFAAGGRVEAANIAQPTPAQAKAGNYSKDHIHVHGLDISIENARGSYRHGVGKDGKPWKSRLPAHYGYIKGTVGADLDHVDCYIGPHIRSPHVYIVDQLNVDTKAFDEHKCFLGFPSKFAAVNAFHEAFSDGKAGQRFGHVTEMTMDEFKNWLHEGNTKKPIRYKAAA